MFANLSRRRRSSRDGSILVGPVEYSNGTKSVFRWTEQEGLNELPHFPGYTSSQIHDMTPDGNWIFGSSQLPIDSNNDGSVGWLWNEETGMQNILDVFQQQGLGDDIAGWQRLALGDPDLLPLFSADGRTIIGTGINPDGNQEAWVAYFDPITICDFNVDGECDIGDLNALLMLGPLAPGIPATGQEDFDLTGDGVIDNADVDQWLAAAATENGFVGPYFRGDAYLDGSVDVSDFNIWNSNRLSLSLAWDRGGDFNGDGAVDASDFNVWNSHRLMSSAGAPAAVPEPACLRLAPSPWAGWRLTGALGNPHCLIKSYVERSD